MDPFVALVSDLTRARALIERLAEKGELPDLLDLIGTLEAYKRDLGALIDEGHEQAAKIMGDYRVTVDGVVWERHRQKRRINWDPDLRRVVLDADRRPLADSDTGEIPNDVDVLDLVYGHPGYRARVGMLRKLGVDPDEFCQTELAGWRVTKARVGPGGNQE